MAAPFTTIFSSQLFLLLSIICLGSSQPTLNAIFCGNANYTNGSTYQTNLNNLLYSLPSAVDPFGFANSTSGQEPERPYAIVLCRGDLQLQDCISCVNFSISQIPQICSSNKDAVGYYDNCMLRYSNRSLAGSPTQANSFYMWNNQNVTSPSEFNQDLRSLLTDLRDKAAGGGSRRKFAAGKTDGPDFQTIYAMMQCTPDLSEKDCSDCLNYQIPQINNCCNGRILGRVIGPSCYLWFQTSLFYNETAVQALSLSPPPPVNAPPPSPAKAPPPTANVFTGKISSTSSSRRRILIITVSCSIAAIVILSGFSIWIILARRRLEPTTLLQTQIAADGMSFDETLHYDFDTIKVATNDFAAENKLGKGGFGPVYKGKLANGEKIAVKRLLRGHGQGDEEFKNEVMLVAKLQHKNLVRLLGFTIEGTERLLVYELVDNLSLDKFLFDPTKRLLLDWDRRYKIIRGVARGLVYLHEDSRHLVIHRDLKTSNVLLDSNMSAKIADFGLARLSSMDETHGSTKRIAGTHGYMAPEYLMQGNFSVKSDVFSFGVLVLEIVSGQKNSLFQNDENMGDLLTFAWERWNEGTVSNLIDPTLRDVGQSIHEIIVRCVQIGLLCCQSKAADRPTMGSVIHMLNSFPLTLSLPTKPFLMENNNNIVSPAPGQQFSSKNDVSFSEMDPR